MGVDWPEFVRLVNSHQVFVLTSHVRPDCDALGSELGMAGILEALGKKVTIVNGQVTPPNLAFIDRRERIQALGEDVMPDELTGFDVLMILDTTAWAQLGPMGEIVRKTTAKKIALDHHVSQDDIGATIFKDPHAEATGRLVVEAAEHLGVELTEELATPLFAAIATDTGWFRFPSTTSETYRCAAKLLDAGAMPDAIYQHLYEQDTIGRVRLRGVVLERLATELDGRFAHTYIRAEDFERTGAMPSDTEDLINKALEIAGVEVAVILIEQLRGGFKISFRSRCALDCSEVASLFSGGGHRAAAGAFVDDTFENTQKRVLETVRSAM